MVDRSVSVFVWVQTSFLFHKIPNQQFNTSKYLIVKFKKSTWPPCPCIFKKM